MRFRKDIQGLRAIAVIAVIIHHFDKAYLPGGYLGVDIFFVISGYVITKSAINQDWSNFFSAFGHFFARRFKRLAPALLLCLFVTSLFTSLFVYNASESLKTAAAAALGLSNVQLFLETTDYFGGAASLNPFTHTWSLSVEEQFYLLFPILAFLCLSSRFPAIIRTVTSICLALVTMASLTAFLIYWETYQEAAFYLIFFRAWQIAAGALLFAISSRLPPVANGIGYVSLAVIAVIFFIPEANIFAWPSLVAVIATLIVIHAGGKKDLAAISSIPFQFFGERSYALYLWHWPVIVIAKWTIGVTIWIIPILFFTMLVLAYLSHRFVEVPLRRSNWSSIGIWNLIKKMAVGLYRNAIKPALGFIRGLSVLSAVLAVIFILYDSLAEELYIGRQVDPNLAPVMSLSWEFTDPFTGYVWAGPKCVFQKLEDIDRGIDPEVCTFGDPDIAPLRILVVGNSFSASFTQGMAKLSRETGWAITVSSSWGARSLGTFQHNADTEYGKMSDAYWTKTIPAIVDEVLLPGDIVLTSSRIIQFGFLSEPLRSNRPKAFERAARAYSQQLDQKGIRLAVLGPLPDLRAETVNCPIDMVSALSPKDAERICAYSARRSVVERFELLVDRLERLEAEGEIIFVDAFDAFCPGTICTHFDAGGELLYRDDFGHPSHNGAISSVPALKDAFAPVLSQEN
ncbi:MAG: acyltransferase family protein [Pseudomonadota bacterium]